MRRGRWSRPGSGWNRPAKTWVPVWRIGLCWTAASGWRELAGRAASCRNALAAIPGLCADRERTFAALQRELAGLGPDWTAERVQRLGRPLSLREALERQAEQRRSAVSDMENAQAAVRRIAEDTKALESELEEQMRQAADVPEPLMTLSEAERERLREAMTRAEEARRRLPEAQTSSAEAERELDQALSRLALEPGTSGRALEALSAGQDAMHRAGFGDSP